MAYFVQIMDVDGLNTDLQTPHRLKLVMRLFCQNALSLFNH